MRTRRLATTLLTLTALAVTSGCQMTSKVDVGRFITSGRDGYQQPEKVIEALDLEPGDRVAEIGAGDGYWIPWLSEAVGPDGVVYAVEVEEDKVAVLEERISEDGYENVDVILGTYDDPNLPDGHVDVALTSLTYHHIEDRVPYFQRLHTDLSQDGRVVHLDNRVGLPFPIHFWTQGHDSDPGDVDREMSEAGYTLLEDPEFLYTQIFVVYGPTTPKAESQ